MAFTYGTITNAKGGNGQTITAYQVRLGYELQSQNIENNTSSIKLQLEARSTSSTYKTYGYNQTTTIDGTSLAAKSFDMRNTNVWQIFGTRTITVNHASNGTYSANKSGSFTTTATGDYSLKNGDASVDVILPTIPRASSITVNDANIGSATNIVINKANSSFTTTLYYKASGQGSFTKIVDKTANQVYGWTVPTSFYSLIPNAKTIQCQFYAETYSGSTLVGTSATVTATFTATGNPVINSFTLQDTNSTTTALTGDSSKMVRYVSNVKATVSSSGQNSASISSNKVNGSSTSSGVVTFNGATTNSYQLVVTDSRGYTTSQTKTMTMVDYVPLTINATIKRNTPTDGKVNISFSGNYFNGSFGSQSNTLTVQYRYKQSSSSSWGSWTSLTATKSGNTYSGSTQLSGLTYTNIYNFEIRAVDKVQTKTITGITVSKGQPIFWWNDSGLNVTGNLKVDGHINGSSSSVVGSYTANGGQQNPNYFGTNKVGFLMMNTSVNGDSHYKDWLIMDCYSGNDVGGAVAFGIDRQEMKAFIMGSDASRTSWTRSAELARMNDIPTNNNQLTNGMGYTTFDSTMGTSGIWTYIKFSNGFAICWGTYVFNSTINNSWGSLYNGAAVEPPNFPFTFTEIQTVTMTPTNSAADDTGYMWILGSYGGSGGKPSTTNPGKFAPSRGSAVNSSQKYAVAITAFGKWK